MADRHLNIFHAYRHGDFEDPKDEPILEDNLTRALLIVLRSSDYLTKEFIKEFTGIDTQGPYKHDLQSRLDPDNEGDGGRSQYQDKCLIAVARRPKEPEVVEISEAESPGGSRPDAWITSDRAAVLFENKHHGRLDDAQIRRHIRVNLGAEFEPVYPSQQGQPLAKRNQVLVVLLSWNDVYSWLRRSLDDQPSLNSVSRYIVCQFLDYLEVNGMGEVKFKQDDFLMWERYSDSDKDRIKTLLGRVETLGEELANEFGEHQVKAQKVSPGYLGVNVMHDGVADIPSDKAPHWSCGLAGRVLRLYIQCESKPLVEKLVKQRDQLIPSLTRALWKAHDLSGLRLQVSEKLHIVSGGSGKNAAVWTGATFIPLELCQDEDTLSSSVGQAFDALEHFLRPEVRKEKLEAAGRGISTWGVLSIEHQWNWLVLQKEGTDITERVKNVARLLKPSYDSLLEAYHRKSPRSRKA